MQHPHPHPTPDPLPWDPPILPWDPPIWQGTIYTQVAEPNQRERHLGLLFAPTQHKLCKFCVVASEPRFSASLLLTFPQVQGAAYTDLRTWVQSRIPSCTSGWWYSTTGKRLLLGSCSSSLKEDVSMHKSSHPPAHFYIGIATVSIWFWDRKRKEISRALFFTWKGCVFSFAFWPFLAFAACDSYVRGSLILPTTGRLLTVTRPCRYTRKKRLGCSCLQRRQP